MYLLGYDIGSSSIKAALVHSSTGEKIAIVQSPELELEILAPNPGWAEQAPETWWQHVCLATKKLLQLTGIKPADIQGIGIAYQMHGLVCIDKNQQVLRPSIIWCDSRAVDIGNRAFEAIGHEKCLSHLLNSPGNFTASKLAWVKANEPAVFEKTDKFMLPGDYIAMRLSGEAMTSACGLSEGILWDFQKNGVADMVLDYFGFEKALIPTVTPSFSLQGKLSSQAASETGLAKGTPVTYRAGDQPNNAMCLNVLQPGEVAATGGTSGVVYGVIDRPKYDPLSRVNGFLHVNHDIPPSPQSPITNPQSPVPNPQKIGILLCINGAGIQYSWTKHQVAPREISYEAMEQLAATVPPGADGLRILPFGNGAERMLGNRDIGARVNNLQFNRHGRAHFYRAALEGIAFSFVFGMGILQEMGMNVQVMRVGNDNLFQSHIFSQTISNLVGSRIEVIETTGAVGAAKAAGVAVGIFSSPEEAMQGLVAQTAFEPQGEIGSYEHAYSVWKEDLKKEITG